MSTIELQKKIKELKELMRMSEELKEEIESLQDDIKAEMTIKKTDELIAGEYKVRWTQVTSNRFDSKAFQQKYSELYNQFTKVTASKRFSIQ